MVELGGGVVVVYRGYMGIMEKKVGTVGIIGVI